MDSSLTSTAGKQIFKEGKNCWRIVHANRVSFLIDGSAFFPAVADAMQKAKRRIFILGWDIDTRVSLRKGITAADRNISDFLDSLLRSRPELKVFMLGWDFAMIYLLEREVSLCARLKWFTIPRLRYRLDARHPVGGSHHQKIVVIDEAIAFLGGFDLTVSRWDTPEHKPFDPRRITPEGEPYNPVHDVQLAVDGEGAEAIAEIARQRWYEATGERLLPLYSRYDPWPERVKEDLHDIEIAIARTKVSPKKQPPIREVECSYIDMIESANHCIYIENQYVSSHAIGKALAKRLKERDGPEIVFVIHKEHSGWMEESTMGVYRARLMKYLRAADRYGRMRLYFPAVHYRDKEVSINVHSKVMVIDDLILRIGSSNLSNRSMGLDSECDVIIPANGNEEISKKISRFRNKLLAEHLGIDAEAFLQRLKQNRGSLIATIEQLQNKHAKTLKDLDISVPEILERTMPETPVFDPDQPISVSFILKSARKDRKLLQLLLAAGATAALLITGATALIRKLSGR